MLVTLKLRAKCSSELSLCVFCSEFARWPLEGARSRSLIGLRSHTSTEGPRDCTLLASFNAVYPCATRVPLPLLANERRQTRGTESQRPSWGDKRHWSQASKQTNNWTLILRVTADEGPAVCQIESRLALLFNELATLYARRGYTQSQMQHLVSDSVCLL